MVVFGLDSSTDTLDAGGLATADPLLLLTTRGAGLGVKQPAS